MYKDRETFFSWLQLFMPRGVDWWWSISPLGGVVYEDGIRKEKWGYQIETNQPEKLLNHFRVNVPGLKVLEKVEQQGGYGHLMKGWVFVDSALDIVVNVNGVMLKIIKKKEGM
jgi:hypothetical protein